MLGSHNDDLYRRFDLITGLIYLMYQKRLDHSLVASALLFLALLFLGALGARARSRANGRRFVCRLCCAVNITNILRQRSSSRPVCDRRILNVTFQHSGTVLKAGMINALSFVLFLHSLDAQARSQRQLAATPRCECQGFYLSRHDH